MHRNIGFIPLILFAIVFCVWVVIFHDYCSSRANREIVYMGKLIEAEHFGGNWHSSDGWKLRFEDGLVVYVYIEYCPKEGWRLNSWYVKNKYGYWRIKNF